VKNAPDNGHPKGRVIARLMGGVVVLAFIAGTMVDVDHPLAQLLGISHQRFLHPYFAYAGLGALCIGLGLVVTCLRRFLSTRFLNNKSG
jgi:hypothetical protein